MANRPLITYGVEALANAGASRVAVCANGDTATLRLALGKLGSGDPEVHFVEDSLPRGPGGCVRDAAGFFGGDDDVVVMEGCLLPDLDLVALLREHALSGADITVGVETNHTGGADTRVYSPGVLGVYIFRRTTIQHIPATGYCDIKEILIPAVHKAGGRVQVRAVKGTAPRITGPGSYLSVNEWAIERCLGSETPPKGYLRKDDALLHTTANVSEEARLAGPVIVGPGTVIRDNATIVGPTSIGARCEIAANSIVCFSALWDEVRVGAGAHVDECVVADGASVAAGSTLRQAVRVARTRRAAHPA